MMCWERSGRGVGRGSTEYGSNDDGLRLYKFEKLSTLSFIQLLHPLFGRSGSNPQMVILESDVKHQTRKKINNPLLHTDV